MTEGDPELLEGQITDDSAAVKSLTDVILLALLEGISRQNTRLANTNGCMHTHMGNQAGNFRPDGGIGCDHSLISGNEAGNSSGSGNEARCGRGPDNEANMGSSSNMRTMAHGGGSTGAPMNLPKFPGYYFPGVQFPAAATQGHPSWFKPVLPLPFKPPNSFDGSR